MKYVALVLAAWVLWLPVTFWCGRVFCRYVCPLGLAQSLVNWLFHPRTKVRRVCTRLPRPWYQRLVNVILLAAYFLTPVGSLLHPWGVVGRVVILFAPGIALAALVLVTAVFGHGRFWCNWVCPLGTMFDWVARLGWRQDEIGRGCGNCRRCFKC